MNTGALQYYPDSEPGVSRKRCGRGFSYIGVDGTLIRDPAERDRLASLAVPPAYEDVWMCPLPIGHLQATGRDARGRKQYIYHPDWTAAQAVAKYDGLVDFGERLPRLRARIERDLQADVGDQEFALAAAVALIDRTGLRVGNPEYHAENGTVGAITMREKHVSLSGNTIAMRFTAKGGKKVRRKMTDAKLARILGRVNDLPGATLLTWVDDDGATQTLKSEVLNAYISEAADADGITAKTFRTWAGTRAAFEAAQDGPTTIKELAEAAAATLHNTATIARNSYIHPAVLDLAPTGAPVIDPERRSGLRVSEQSLLSFLKTV